MQKHAARSSIATAVLVGAQMAVCSLSHAAPQTDCGTITYPQSGRSGVVHIAAGDISCADATAMLGKYLNDPALVRSGNTEAAQFDGWLCASPTANAAQLDGYSTSCSRGGAEVQIRPIRS